MSEAKILEIAPVEATTPAENPAFDAGKIQLLKSSIADIGQQVPGLVMRNPHAPPTWLCIAGNKRLACCRDLGVKFRAVEVPANLTEADVTKLRLTENAIRQAMSPVELADDILRFMRLTKCTQAEAAEKLHLAPSAVSRALSVRRLAPDLKAHVDNFEVVPSVAYMIASLPTLDLQREAMRKAIGPPKLSRDAVRLLVERAKRSAGSKRERKPAALRGKIDGREFRLGLKKDDTVESVAETLKTVIGRLTKYKELPPGGWGWLFSGG